MNRPLFAAVLLASCAALSGAAEVGGDSPVSSLLARAGLEAFKRGDAKRANELWRACLSTAPAKSPSMRDCLAGVEFTQGLKEKRAVAAPAPGAEEGRAERLFLDGATAYRDGDDARAADLWRRCLAAAPKGATAENCRSGLERLATPESVQQSYLEGVIYYQNGDYDKARKSWQTCVRSAPPGATATMDCAAGLQKLSVAGDFASTLPDGKK